MTQQPFDPQAIYDNMHPLDKPLMRHVLGTDQAKRLLEVVGYICDCGGEWQEVVAAYLATFRHTENILQHLTGKSIEDELIEGELTIGTIQNLLVGEWNATYDDFPVSQIIPPIQPTRKEPEK